VRRSWCSAGQWGLRISWHLQSVATQQTPELELAVWGRLPRGKQLHKTGHGVWWRGLNLRRRCKQHLKGSRHRHFLRFLMQFFIFGFKEDDLDKQNRPDYPANSLGEPDCLSKPCLRWKKMGKSRCLDAADDFNSDRNPPGSTLAIKTLTTVQRKS